MDNQTLIILSLIHDLKVPLAVVEFGTHSILSQNTETEHLKRQQKEILQHVQNDNARAKQLTNRLLDTATFESPIENLLNLVSEKPIIKHLAKAFTGQKSPADRLKAVLTELEITLSRIEDNILAFERSTAKEVDLPGEHHRIIKRVLRNSRVAARLIKHGITLLAGDMEVSQQDVTISQIIIQPLIEVFDLKDDSISEPLQISDSIEAVRQICREGGIFFTIDDGLWTQKCRLDSERINQVIVNLLLNSMKFRRSKTEISVNRKKNNLILSIGDDGEGLFLDDQSQNIGIRFKKQQSANDFSLRGHGFGLIGVQAILEQLNGRLTLETIQGKGAKFTATVPCEFETGT